MYANVLGMNVLVLIRVCMIVQGMENERSNMLEEENAY